MKFSNLTLDDQLCLSFAVLILNRVSPFEAIINEILTETEESPRTRSLDPLSNELHRQVRPFEITPPSLNSSRLDHIPNVNLPSFLMQHPAPMHNQISRHDYCLWCNVASLQQRFRSHETYQNEIGNGRSSNHALSFGFVLHVQQIIFKFFSPRK